MSGGVPAGELLPCPFCGMAVTLIERDKLFVFRCPDESPCVGVGFATYGKVDQRETAIAAWNRRATPAGWVLVPVEPTEAMWQAAWDASENHFVADKVSQEGLRLGLSAMLAAAPTPPIAVKAVLQCNYCDDGDWHSPEYYDAAGKWVHPAEWMKDPRP